MLLNSFSFQDQFAKKIVVITLNSALLYIHIAYLFTCIYSTFIININMLICSSLGLFTFNRRPLYFYVIFRI